MEKPNHNEAKRESTETDGAEPTSPTRSDIARPATATDAAANGVTGKRDAKRPASKHRTLSKELRWIESALAISSKIIRVVWSGTSEFVTVSPNLRLRYQTAALAMLTTCGWL
jgi:hypothetical protein